MPKTAVVTLTAQKEASLSLDEAMLLTKKNIQLGDLGISHAVHPRRTVVQNAILARNKS